LEINFFQKVKRDARPSPQQAGKAKCRTGLTFGAQAFNWAEKKAGENPTKMKWFAEMVNAPAPLTIPVHSNLPEGKPPGSMVYPS
jgi:hypothetical protein